MQISGRFTIAVHVLTCIEIFKNEDSLNSEFIAKSVGANPVIIRKIFGQLKKAGLITVSRGGNGGVSLAKNADDITLYDTYKAVDLLEDGELFHFHENPDANCPVGKNIHYAMDGRLKKIQSAMESEMASMTIADVIADTENRIENDKKSGRPH